MTLPAAPVEGGGAKLHYLVWDNAGTNAAAVVKAIARESLNAESQAHMAVATHADTETYGAGDPVVLVAGINGTDILPLSLNADGEIGVHDGGNSLTVDNAGTFAVQATVASGATTIGKAEDVASASGDVGVPAMAIQLAAPTNTAGTDGDYSMLQMSAGRLWASATIDAALPAGTNNIGDVDVLSVIPGTGATNSGKAIDSVAGATDTGVAILAIRDDALSTLTPAEGDYVPLRTNSTGALHVTGGGGGTEYVVDDAAPAAPTGATFVMERDDALATLTEVEGDWTNPRATSKGALWVAIPDSSGNPITSFGGGTQFAEDAAHVSADVGTMALAVRTDTPANRSGADGDYEPLQVSAGRLWASATIDAAIPAGTNNIGDIDVLSVVPGTGASNLGKAEDAAHSSADVGVMALAVRTDTPTNRSGTDGDYEPLQMAAGRVWASATIDAALPAGTNNIGDIDVLSVVPGTGATNLGKAIDSAVGSTDTGVATLAVRTNSLATLTPANSDYVPLRTTAQGELYTAHAKPTLASSNNTAITTATTTTLVAAPSAGNHLRILYIQASNSSATATKVGWRDGAAGAMIFETHLPQNGVFAHRITGGWDLTTATLFALNTSAAGNVYWTVEYQSLAD